MHPDDDDPEVGPDTPDLDWDEIEHDLEALLTKVRLMRRQKQVRSVMKTETSKSRKVLAAVMMLLPFLGVLIGFALVAYYQFW